MNLVKIGDRIINLDQIVDVFNFQTETTMTLTLTNAGMGKSIISGYDAEKLWKCLVDMARDLEIEK